MLQTVKTVIKWQDGEFTPAAQVTMYMLSLILGLSGFAYMWIANQ